MIYDAIIETGLLLLLVYTPLAFGGVTDQALMVLETGAGLLLLVWLAKTISLRRRTPEDALADQHPRRFYFRWDAIPCAGLLLFFLGLFILQQVPLPVSIVKTVSPQTYQLYADAAETTAASLPQWLTLSVCAQATESEFLKFLAYTAIFFLIINTIRHPKQITRLVYTIITVGVLESLYSLSQLFAGEQFLFFYPKTHLMQGSFINKNHFAGYIGMVVFLMLGVIFTRFEGSYARAHKAGTPPSPEKYAKASLTVWVLLILFCAHLLSGSRGGLISLACGALFFTFMGNMRRMLRRWVVWLLIILPLLILIIIFVFPTQIFQYIVRFTGEEFNISFQTRWEIWKTQLHIFQDFPALGSGAGTLAHLAQKYQTFRWNYRLAHSESDLMQLLAEMGTIGVLLMLGIGTRFFLRTVSFWKQRRSRWTVAMAAGGFSALVSILVHGIMDFNLHIPSNALLTTVIAALTYSTVSLHKGRFAGKKKKLALSPFMFYSLMLGMIIVVGVYLTCILNTFRAVWNYQQATRVIASESTQSSGRILNHLQTALASDWNHPQYPYAMGISLWQSYTTSSEQQNIAEVEEWIRHAILLDPANPEYYYDMGRIYGTTDVCLPTTKNRLSGFRKECPVIQYFLAALRNDPKDTFLRTKICQWLYSYNRDDAIQLIRAILQEDDGPPLKNVSTFQQQFAKFLYDIELDYESDFELRKVGKLEPAQCEETRESEDEILELKHDDNSAEWKASLASETSRIKKVFCLPEDITNYGSASLNILMNRSGRADFDVKIAIDDHPIFFSQPISYIPRWHEIPFDTSLLHGKTTVNVYIRSTRSSDPGSILEIWGDRDTPTTQSVFNFQQTKDLSPEKGKQTGEYMIRLILRK